MVTRRHGIPGGVALPDDRLAGPVPLSPRWAINVRRRTVDHARVTRSARPVLAVALAATLAACGQGGASWKSDLLKSSTRVDAAESAAVATDDGSGPHWAYTGEHGPETWGKASPEWKTCEEGGAQSPLDLSKASRYQPSADAATPGAAGEQKIAMSYRPSAITTADTDQYLRIDFADAGAMVIDGDRYALQELHVHTPSEHSLGGVRYRAEYQLVHRNAKDEVAIVAVMVQGGADNIALAPVVASLSEPGGQHAGAGTVDPASLVPQNWTMVRYDGSMTAPPCTENVRWHVMLNPQTMSASQLEALTSRFPGSARPVQDANGRRIVVEIDALTGVVKDEPAAEEPEETVTTEAGKVKA